MRDELHLPCRRAQNNLYRYFLLKDVYHNSSLVKCALHIVTFFQRVQLWKERGKKRSTFTVEVSDKPCFSQLIKINTDKSLDSVLPWCYERKMVLYYCSLSYKTFNPSLIMSKISDKCLLRDYFIKCLQVIPKTIMAIKNSLRNCHSQEKSKETWWLNVMWCPGWDPRNKNGIYLPGAFWVWLHDR